MTIATTGKILLLAALMIFVLLMNPIVGTAVMVFLCIMILSVANSDYRDNW